MTGFAPLFTIEIRHGFYPDGPAGRLLPLERTLSLMHNAGLILRENPDGITIFYENPEPLKAYANDPAADLAFYFKLVSSNPLFENFTCLPDRASGQTGFLTSEGKSTDGDHICVLTAGDAFSGLDLKDCKEPPLTGLLSRADRLIPPVCLVSIRPDPEDLTGHKTYVIPFERRETLWHYYFLGAFARADLTIEDLDGRVGFEPAGQADLPGGTDRPDIFGNFPIPLGETRRFRLKKKNSHGDQVLVRQLASAPLDRVTVRITPDRQKEFISEIFINP